MKNWKPLSLVLIGLAQPLSGTLAPVLGIGTPIGSATRNSGAPEQALPFFFSIWSVIFLAYLVFVCLYAARREPWMERIATPLLVAGAGNVIWMLSAQLIVSQLVDFVLLFPIAASAWLACYRFDRVRGMGGSAAKLVADAATGLLGGWITVAVCISIPIVVRAVTALGPTDWPWQMLWAALVPAVLAAWVFARRISRSLWFFVALGWGLAGIVANNWYVTGMHWCAIVTAMIGLILLHRRLTRGANGARQGA